MLGNDLVAAVIVTIMLIPQSLAYAMLAGLPP
ncbi:MAG: SulP family inorganic anion transporter [Luteimonas sp.]